MTMYHARSYILASCVQQVDGAQSPGLEFSPVNLNDIY